MKASLLLLGLLGAAPLARAQAEPTYAFVDVHVVPMDRERVLERHTVVVAGDRIVALGPSADVQVPASALRIPSAGKYLVPGLGDAHAHLSTPGGGADLAERALVLSALSGVTMVRGMYTEPHHDAARARVERGEIVGPRTVLVAPALTGQNAASPEAARELLRRHAAAGYRLAKILPGLSRETFDAAAAEARTLGLALTGHVPLSVPLQDALGAGYVSIEHLDGFLEAMIRPDSGATPAASGFFGLGLVDSIDESRMPALVQAVRQAGVPIVPTQAEIEIFVGAEGAAALAGREEMRYAPADLLARWKQQKEGFARGAGLTVERSARYVAQRRKLILELHRAGVPIALGSDAFNLFAVPGFGVFRELEAYVAAGLSPYDALRTSTVGVAKLLALPGATGTIALGGPADLVLLDGNPLADIAQVRRQAGVMLRGRWMSRDSIDDRLREIAAPRPPATR